MITCRNRFFYLDTEHTSYIMQVHSNGVLQHVYYGKRIPQENLNYYHLLTEGSFCPPLQMNEQRSSFDTLPQEYTTLGRGDFRQPSLILEGEDGRNLNELTYVEYRVVQGRGKLPKMPYLDTDTEQVQTLIIAMRDKITGADVFLYYSVFAEEDVISRYVTIQNETKEAIQIRKAASLALDLEGKELDMISLQGSWLRERSIRRQPLTQGAVSISSRRGSSSHQLNPFAAFASQNADECSGEVYGVSLVYSADFQISAEVSQYNDTRLQAGINPETFSWKLLPGETFTTPEALVTYSGEGFETMSHNFHNVCRNHLGKCADKTLRHPIIINSWEAMYFDLSEEKLKNFITDCKGLGIDTFVLDDGWFGHRDDDNSSLGDWFVDERKFKKGLEAVIDFCHENGMKFGIWFEPEMISRDSLLFRLHPDWCIHCKQESPLESRRQLVLDMSRAEVVDNIFEQMARFIRKYDISYIKWDFNRNLTDVGSETLSKDQQKEFTHRYMLGVYDLMERLNKHFPEVFFEGCSGGGGRFDFGILYYMPQIWTSDNSDSIERLKIQYGTSFVYPPSTMVAHVSACPNHQTWRSAPFETRGEVAQMCNYGYELNIGTLSESEKNLVREQIKRHRELEPLISEGDFYRIRNPFECDLCAWQLVSADKKKAYMFVGFETVHPNAKGEYLRFRGLEPAYDYYIRQLDVTVSGKTLMNAGVPVKYPLQEYVTMAFDLECKNETL